MSSQLDEEAAAEDIRKLSFQQRHARVVAFAREHGVEFRAVPIDMGGYVAIPKTVPIDVWASEEK